MILTAKMMRAVREFGAGLPGDAELELLPWDDPHAEPLDVVVTVVATGERWLLVNSGHAVPHPEGDGEPGRQGVQSPDDGINMREAADRLGVHWQTVRNWIAAGQLPATRFGPSGKIIRIDPADLARVRRPA